MITELTYEIMTTLKAYPSRKKIGLKCYTCNKTFFITKNDILTKYRRNISKKCFCSVNCHRNFVHPGMFIFCKQCTKKVKVKSSDSKFCSQSCAATYNNKHKKTGHRRSKLELAIEQKLLETGIKFVCNDRKTIGYELDFYFPELKKAVEINGIYHYKSVHSEAQFKKIQRIDQEKIVRCRKLGIELHIELNTYKLFNSHVIALAWYNIKKFCDI